MSINTRCASCSQTSLLYLVDLPSRVLSNTLQATSPSQIPDGSGALWNILTRRVEDYNFKTIRLDAAHQGLVDASTSEDTYEPPQAAATHQAKDQAKIRRRYRHEGRDTFAALLAPGPAEPFRLLSHAISLSPVSNSVTLLGVHQNRSKNLIVSLPHGTSDAHVDAITTVIHSTFTPLCSFPLSVTCDVAWTKLMVSSVPTRPKPGDPTYSEEEVRSSFLLNPAVKALSIMRNPRWIRNPASITGAHSSFTFSFQDPDGSIGRALAKSRLFVFGKPVHLKRWTDKPRRTRDIPQA
ncbi:muscle M-line assembly protein unc-89 [Ceratobasidium sp. AG-Ba]|nr:muscle M-line assembly protein unc-89 [Ceratobasidium sp. AG-Ba]